MNKCVRSNKGDFRSKLKNKGKTESFLNRFKSSKKTWIGNSLITTGN